MAGGEAGVTLGQPHLSRQDLATLVRFRFAWRMQSDLGSGDGLFSRVALGLDSAGLSGAWGRGGTLGASCPASPLAGRGGVRSWDLEHLKDSAKSWC
jgi:hypothetical protein